MAIETTENNHQQRRTSKSWFWRPIGAAALLAAMAIPFAVGGGVATANAAEEKAPTTYQLSVRNAQSFTVPADVVSAPLSRSHYSATTAEEVKAIEDARAAAAAAKKQAELDAKLAAQAKEATAVAQAQAASLGGESFTPDPSYGLVAPGSGEIRWPLPTGSWTLGERLGAGRDHQGVDMIAPEGTPIYAVAAGTVVIAQNGYFGWGTTVEIHSTVGGQALSSLYAHMPVSSYVVNAGDEVQAGQLIGYVGNTGNSFGAHLHLELRINGSLIDGFDWLTANS